MTTLSIAALDSMAARNGMRVRMICSVFFSLAAVPHHNRDFVSVCKLVAEFRVFDHLAAASSAKNCDRSTTFCTMGEILYLSPLIT